MERDNLADNGGQPGGQEASGAWLDLRSAAVRLGLSERTLHRHAAAGKVSKRQADDGRVEVWVPSTAADTLADIDRQAVTTERAMHLVSRYQQDVSQAVSQQLGPLTQALERSEQRALQLAEENGRLKQQLDELQRSLSATSADTVRQDVASPAEPPKRPWWAFWRV